MTPESLEIGRNVLQTPEISVWCLLGFSMLSHLYIVREKLRIFLLNVKPV